MAAILEISDGTTTVNLLDKQGFLLDSWRPNIAFYKGGGVFQQSSLSTGRQLVDKQFTNYTDTFNLKLSGDSQDVAIFKMQELRRLIEKASAYWVADFQNDPVWIKAKATRETNARYSLIVVGRIEEDENPYNQPFLQPEWCNAVMNNLVLAIEHKFWTPNEPGVGTAVAISAVETYDGRNLGNVDSAGVRDPTTDDEVYIATKRNVANLTHVFVDDGGVVGANLMDAVLPFALLPAVPVAGDYIFFGIDVTLADSGPFSSLVFDIGTAGAGYTATWEYWNGAWVTLAVQDNTNADGLMTGIPLDTTGAKSVHWEQPSDWVTVNLFGGTTAYWVRLVINTTPGALTAPTQQNRDIYSIVWPYVEIQSTEVLGDIAALARMLIRNQSGVALTNPMLYSNRVLVGLRSTSRGTNFTPYLNAADEQNPVGITVTGAAVVGLFTNWVQSPTGRVINCNPGAVGGELFVAYFAIGSPIISEYYGRYHVFIRAYQHAGALGEISMSMRVSISNTATLASDIIPAIIDKNQFSVLDKVELLDFGVVEIPGETSLRTSKNPNFFLFSIAAESFALPSAFYLYDLILLPVDEFAGDFEDQHTAYQTAMQRRSKPRVVELDSISEPRVRMTSLLMDDIDDDNISASWIAKAPSAVFLQANATQRIYFLQEKLGTVPPADPLLTSNAEIASSISIFKNHRYLSSRGGR